MIYHERSILTVTTTAFKDVPCVPRLGRNQGTHSISEGVSSSVQALAVLGEGLWVGGTSGVALVPRQRIALGGLRELKMLGKPEFLLGKRWFIMVYPIIFRREI